MPWVAPLVAPPVEPACVGHRYGGPPAVQEHQVAAPEPLELVSVICLQVCAPLELEVQGPDLESQA